jgi:hypothetical protein
MLDRVEECFRCRGRLASLARVSGLSLVAFVMMVPASSTAAPTWLAARSCPVATEPQVAVDAAGHALAVWRCSTAIATNGVIQASVGASASGSWNAPQNLQGSESELVVNDDLRPVLALNGSGDAVVVWSRFGEVGGNDDLVQAAVRSGAGGSWTGAQELFVGGGVHDPGAAIDPAGDAVAVWQVCSKVCPGAVWAAVRPAGGSWSAPQRLTAPGEYASTPRVALDRAGDAVAVWTAVGSAGLGSLVRAAVRTAAAGAWSAPETLSAAGPGNAVDEPQAAFDAAGDALAAWPAFADGKWLVQTAERSAATGNWSAAQDLPGTTEGRQVLQLALAVEAAGGAAAIWRRGSEGQPPAVVQASVRSGVGGSWSAPSTLYSRRYAGAPAVALDGAGNAVAVWQDPVYTEPYICHDRCRFEPPIVLAAARPAASGTWSAPQSWRGGEPQVAVDPGGDAVAVSVVHDRNDIVQAAVRPAKSATWSTPQYVSASAPPCLVPRLIGKTFAKAKAALEREDCRVGRVSRVYSQTERKGHVLRPAAQGGDEAEARR